MLCLASGAMAQLAVQRLLPAQLIFDLAAVTARLVQGLEVFVWLMYSVRRPHLPLVFLRQVFMMVFLELLGSHGLTDRSFRQLEGYYRRGWHERGACHV